MPDQHYCRGCQVLAEAQAELPQDGDKRPLPGFHPFLQFRDVYDRLHPIDDSD